MIRIDAKSMIVPTVEATWPEDTIVQRLGDTALSVFRPRSFSAVG